MANIAPPPHSEEAEMNIIGSVMLDPEMAGGLAAERMRADDFYVPRNRIIFQELLAMHADGAGGDLFVLKDRLAAKKMLSAAGGLEYLLSINQYTLTSANVEHHIATVRDRAILRRVADAARKIYSRTTSGEPASDVVNGAEAEILGLHDASSAQTITMVEAAKLAMKRIFSRVNDGLKTGFGELDSMTAGLQPGQLIIIAGRPSMGKTTFGLNCSLNLAAAGVPAAFFSLEMSAAQLAINMLSCLARIDSAHLRGQSSGLSGDETKRLLRAGDKLFEMPIYIDECSALDPVSLRIRARRLIRMHGVKIIFVDYLQQMQSSVPAENRQQEISRISRELKTTAMELAVPIVAMCQLSRGPEARDDRRPRMSDLRESGAIEQDADVVGLLYRDFYYYPEKEEVRNEAELNIAKNRIGRTGPIKLAYHGQFFRFANPASVSEQAIAEEGK